MSHASILIQKSLKTNISHSGFVMSGDGEEVFALEGDHPRLAAHRHHPKRGPWHVYQVLDSTLEHGTEVAGDQRPADR